ncbi:MAG: hypothetical protein IBX55_20480 [Methyloprofundus sp.]|nr:hypothetical protein [Methyloprofundus sp.]
MFNIAWMNILSKKAGMHHPNRAGNFDGEMNEVELQNLLLKSLNLN